ncbi:MAG: malate synthase G [Candidatus Latescibacteria bacterium]|nr:malate synthase G [Candidatus Latescibacterota bacterium]
MSQSPKGRIEAGGLQVDAGLHGLIEQVIAPGTGVEPAHFWASLAAIVRDLGPRNRTLLERRDALQEEIDQWHRDRQGQPLDAAQYRTFLEQIGYLLPEDGACRIATENVDAEIALQAGPQLVVPVDNARYALNAANARWGSLYDALYGTDVVPESGGAEKGGAYNVRRGELVIARSETLLDEVAPLAGASHSQVVQYGLEERGGRQVLVAQVAGGGRVQLQDPAQLAGYRAEGGQVQGVLLCHHGLHLELQIDRQHPVGQHHRAGVKDVVLEAALTTIQDCEDSVAAVDAADKVRVYTNWCGLMRGDLQAEFDKGGRKVARRLNPDRAFTTPDGSALVLPGRSLMLVRHVGIHMYTDAVTTVAGEEIPEGFLDAMVITLAAIHDLKGTGPRRNSRTGSIYVVKPKMHGPEEVRSTVELFGRVEQALGLAANTLKMGIMDEERRTTINLVECIRVAGQRLVFINTGFLDRTGDEIHTSMELGAMFPKMEIKKQPWLAAYEDWNVDVGIAAGLVGRAQIGKGMWTMPDRMREMVETKIGHPRAGATTAWVPSPTAAVLHALHYHQVKVAERLAALASRQRASLEAILTPPILDRKLTPEAIQKEIDNNAQGILGYVVRWVGQGIGCSKVPDIDNVGLMEDRATLRISSQHIANWLHHGLVGEAQVRATFERMAAVVDQQNAGDPNYRNMAPDLAASLEFQAALELVFAGRREPNGYTERVLHGHRRQAKAQNH